MTEVSGTDLGGETLHFVCALGSVNCDAVRSSHAAAAAQLHRYCTMINSTDTPARMQGAGVEGEVDEEGRDPFPNMDDTSAG